MLNNLDSRKIIIIIILMMMMTMMTMIKNIQNHTQPNSLENWFVRKACDFHASALDDSCPCNLLFFIFNYIKYYYNYYSELILFMVCSC